MPCVATVWKRLLSLIHLVTPVERVLITTWSKWLLTGACPGAIRSKFDFLVFLFIVGRAASTATYLVFLSLRNVRRNNL